ncbi:MAG: T9SS type A sorting domain-containing protein [Candidatus Cloacimonetes bacterium]|nr:T9SS type A sorting domain-containing protein [Candidatus Cloacimonadota bacterium]
MKKIIILISALIFTAISLHADLSIHIPFDPQVIGPAYNDSTYNYESEYFDVVNTGAEDDFTVMVDYVDIPTGWSMIWCHLYQGAGACHLPGFPWHITLGAGDTLKLDFTITVSSAGSMSFSYKFTAASLPVPVNVNFEYTTGVSVDDPQIQNQISVKNSPNPFSGSTTISFTSQNNFNKIADITIYNIKGETIKILDITPDMNSVTWDGTDQNGESVPNGVYFYSTSFEDETIITDKLLLLK